MRNPLVVVALIVVIVLVVLVIVIVLVINDIVFVVVIVLVGRCLTNEIIPLLPWKSWLKSVEIEIETKHSAKIVHSALQLKSGRTGIPLVEIDPMSPRKSVKCPFNILQIRLVVNKSGAQSTGSCDGSSTRSSKGRMSLRAVRIASLTNSVVKSLDETATKMIQNDVSKENTVEEVMQMKTK
jgi:hypothetical protein